MRGGPTQATADRPCRPLANTSAWRIRAWRAGIARESGSAAHRVGPSKLTGVKRRTSEVRDRKTLGRKPARWRGPISLSHAQGQRRGRPCLHEIHRQGAGSGMAVDLDRSARPLWSAQLWSAQPLYPGAHLSARPEASAPFSRQRSHHFPPSTRHRSQDRLENRLHPVPPAWRRRAPAELDGLRRPRPGQRLKNHNSSEAARLSTIVVVSGK